MKLKSLALAVDWPAALCGRAAGPGADRNPVVALDDRRAWASASTSSANGFNASQKDYKVVPVYKGSYPESMTAAIAAFRAGNAPHIVQVFEVGTATMMAAKGAIMPVYKC